MLRSFGLGSITWPSTPAAAEPEFIRLPPPQRPLANGSYLPASHSIRLALTGWCDGVNRRAN